MRERVLQAEATAEGNSLWDLVEKVNPGAKQINAEDAGWFTFLAQVDPISGRLYRELGEAAAQIGDIQRLAELIDAYRKSANLAKPVVPVKPSQRPTAPLHDGSRKPEVKGKRYTQTEIREFYDAQARGNLKGMTPEEIQAKEDDIDAAMMEGRVDL
jgi:hypothetical protein